MKLLGDGPAGLLGFALLCPAVSSLAYKVDSKRNQIQLESLTDFDACVRDFGGNQYCLDALKRRADAKPAESFDAGKKARSSYQSWTALYFFEKAFDRSVTAEQCSDEDVELAVLSGLDLSAGRGSEPEVARAVKIADQCWTQLQAKLVAGFAVYGGDDYSANLCPILKARGSEPEQCSPRVETAAAQPEVDAEILALATLNRKDLELDFEKAIVLRGAEHEQILVVRAAKKNEGLVVVKFTGVQGPWSDQFFVARERFSNGGTRYVALVDGKEWTLVDVDTRSGYPVYEVHPRDSAAVPAYRVELEDFKKVDSKSVASEFE